MYMQLMQKENAFVFLDKEMVNESFVELFECAFCRHLSVRTCFVKGNVWLGLYVERQYGICMDVGVVDDFIA